MALENTVATERFNQMLTELRTSKEGASLTAEQVAERMSDWIIASSIQSTVHVVKKLPPAPEIGKIYLLKTGQYSIHNPNGKAFTGSLYDICAIRDEIADNETKKIKNKAGIAQLKTQLANSDSNPALVDPELIFQVVKITTKMGHNPYEAKKQTQVRNKCLLIIDPAKLQNDENDENKIYLLNKKSLILDNNIRKLTPVTFDFYMKEVSASLELQKKPQYSLINPVILKLLFVFGTIIGLMLNVLLNGAIAVAIYYIISLEMAQAFAIWAAFDIFKKTILLPLINGISNLLFSPKTAAIITASCGIIISAMLAYQFIIRDFFILAIFNIGDIVISNPETTPSYIKNLLDAMKMQDQPTPAQEEPLTVNEQALAFRRAAYLNAQQKPDSSNKPAAVFNPAKAETPVAGQPIVHSFNKDEEDKSSAAANDDQSGTPQRRLSISALNDID